MGCPEHLSSDGPRTHSPISHPWRLCCSAQRLQDGRSAAGLTLNIQQRKMAVGFRCQREVEAMATLRFVTVHNAYCLDQLRGESRGENRCCPQRAHSQGPSLQRITSFCHSQG